MGLKNLLKHRNDILFAEIGVLIHDLGKLSKEFVESKSEDGNYPDFHHHLVANQIYLYLNGIANNIYASLQVDKNTKKTNNPEKLYHYCCLIEIFYYRNLVNDIDKILKILDKAITDFNNSDYTNNFVQKYIDCSSLSQKDKEFLKRKLPKLRNIKRFSYIDSNVDLISVYILNLLENIKINIDFFHPDLSFLKASINDFIGLHHLDFVLSHKNLIPYVVHLLDASHKGADGVDSAIDKMVSNTKFSLQSKNNTYISTAFGYEGEETKIDSSLNDTDEKSLTKIRNDYADKLYSILKNIIDNLQDTHTSIQDIINNWINKRKELLQATKEAFLNALGETRRPANDVTLWDHSFSVASLYKAALAEVLINGWKAPKDIKWKLLGIRFNGDEFYNNVPKIADVLGRKALVEKILDTIKSIIEVVIPIGNEIYRDENGNIFLVPESVDEEKIIELNEVDEEGWDKIKKLSFNIELGHDGQWKSKQLGEVFPSKPESLRQLVENISSYISNGIFIPEITVSFESRGAVNLGNEILNRKFCYKSDIDKLKGQWSDKNSGYEKCSACGLMPIGDLEKAKERKICESCLKLAQNRVEEWCGNDKWNKENPEKPARDLSIWLSEVADDNNRIGLVYLSFELDRWLNGEMLNTFFSSPFLMDEFKNEFSEIKQIPDYQSFISILKECFEENDFNHSLPLIKDNGTKLTVKEFLKNLTFIKEEQNPEEVFDSIVSSREPDWQNKYPIPTCAITKGDNYHKAAVFLLNITRKHPSFARLRRIWETTKRFGVEVIEHTKNKSSKKNRTIFEFQSDNLKPTHTYWAKVSKNGKEYRLEFVVVEQNKAAVIWKSDENLNIEEHDELILCDESFRRNSETSIKVNNSSSVSYMPIIPYQVEPTKTMFFMPLKEAWEIVKYIKEKYEIEFSKVQNKLPIKIGFVAFHKRTPMYAVLDAVKRLINKKSEEKIFEVCDITEMDSQKNCILFEGELGNKVKELHLKSNEREKSFEVYVSYSTGDPNKEDLFHPYFIIENHNGWKVPYNGEWKNIKHIKDIKQSNRVLFCPSYFDFLYLDTNTRRLDAGITRKHWLFKKASPKPYLLQDIDKFSRLKELLLDKSKLTSSQILNIYGLLIEKLQMWEIDEIETLPISDSTFESFVENTILGVPLRLKIKDETRKGQITREDFEFLKETILSGLFFDFIDMWHTVLKREFNKREGNNE